MKKFLKIFLRFFIYLFLILTVAFSWTILTLYGEGKKIPPQIISYIEDSIESLSDDIEVFVSNAEIKFISYDEGFDISLKDGYVQLSKNVVASIPEIHAKLKLKDLLLFKIKLKEVYLERPQFVIKANKTDNYLEDSFSGSFFSVYKNIVYNLFEAINKENNLIPVEKVLVNNAYFSFNQQGTFQNLMLKKASLEFYTLQNSTYLKTSVETDINLKHTQFQANAKLLDNDNIILSFNYTEVPFEVFSNFVGLELDWINNISPVLNGKGTILMDKENIASTISIDTGFKFNSKNFKNTFLDFKGEFNFSPDEEEIIQPKLDANITLGNLEMEKLGDLWPEDYATEIRNNVVSNYAKGKFKDITLHAQYKFQDLAFNKILEEKFDVKGNIQKSFIKFDQRYPMIEDVTAFFFFDGENLVLDLKKGAFGKFKIGKSFLEIQDINNPVAIIKIKGKGNGKIAELKPLLAAITKNRDKEFYYNTHDIKGTADINFYYKDNINNGFDEKYVELKIDGKLKNIKIKEAFKGINFISEELKISATKEGLKISGEGTANTNSKTKVNVFIGFIKENHYTIKLTSNLNSYDAKNTINQYEKYIQGEAKLKLNYESLENNRIFTGKIDFTNSKVNFPEISLVKEEGKFLQSSFFGHLIPEKAIEIANFQIIDERAISEGSAIVSLNDNFADEIYFSKLLSGKNNSELYYSNSEYLKKETIKINGNSFDSEYILKNLKTGNNSQKSLNLEMNVKNLYLKHSVSLQNVKASVKCGINECFSSNFKSQIDSGGNLDIKFLPDESGKKTFVLKTDNFGRVAEGLGFKDNLSNGEALIIASKNPENLDKENITEGTIEIKDFKIMKAPVLAKIFSLASITGITELLTNSGIKMDKLKGNFSLNKNYLSINKITASGNSLGLTLQGTTDFTSSEIDFTGVVTPSYSINSMLGKIPAIGFLFKAKEGEGLIATKYSVKGKYPDVDVSVNALSALTPGVLREVWGRAETNKSKQ